MLALSLICAECGAESDARVLGWRALVGGTEKEDDVEVVVFCPDCAEREFGEAA